MVNLERKLTVDDLIVEYMMYKVKNGYEPSFLTLEFMDFLRFFESKMQVEDSLYENDKLFQRFFERKAKSDWSRTINWYTSKKEVVPHMEMVYSEKDNDYLIKANYKLSDFDKSVINTYFMDNGRDDYRGKIFEIRSIIGEYLSTFPKRKIDESIEINESDLIIGKYVAAEIIANVWESYIKEQIENHKWPKQCSDINKYLFEIDLAEIIGVESIKSQLLQLYGVISKRIAILYHQDVNLRISTASNVYLARANYELLIEDYEKIIGIAFGNYKKSLDVDLSTLTFRRSYEFGDIYYWDDSSNTKTIISTLGNDKVKKLVKILDKSA